MLRITSIYYIDSILYLIIKQSTGAEKFYRWIFLLCGCKCDPRTGILLCYLEND